MKILTTGSHGLLGTNILPVLERSFTVIPYDIEEWDITDRDAGERTIRDIRPDVILNLAAYTNVDECEDCLSLADRVNAEAPGIIAKLCSDHNIKFVHISTDYVFDGEKETPYREDDETNPTSVYGLSKLSGEKKVLANCPDATIIRTQWLYGHGGINFITKITKIAREQGVAEVVNDQRGCPTYAKDIADPILLLIEKNRSGIYHVANAGSCTWFDFAREIFSCLHIDVVLKPITSEQLNRKANRPRNSVFDCSRLFRDTGHRMRTWQDALHDYLS
ncbi:MAG TPA: dTDP-4-dehydrorhamnose reductase [Syntrophorhabdus sp.]|nr:dTDP-4-dehydrorhamnose reductase [Syntrophorhabdus sp.]OPX95648.1 MAG: dTDP-4-dehydrorhamnose reductase [Syntrophorhabdus sp. PtaB.Bin027]OQB74283.1 MAG: dTDP-4-dehydrorhamnose reductase [Deltaproteobacteria bacterium ADurb.Bin135]MBP8743788.1 dTDP-4-dehydrorhamnose reductase [Syntrophorhabdus sp.]NMC94368.1 dTDP-4-dehydrorhamnose reductase [Syntrophorhabdus sp.]